MSRRHPATRAALAGATVLALLAYVVLVVGGCAWAGIALSADYPSPQHGWEIAFGFLATGLLVCGPLLAWFVWKAAEWGR